MNSSAILTSLSLAALALAGCDRFRLGIDEVRLYAFDCGRMETNDLGVFSDDGAYDGRSGTLANGCFLVRHPEGDLLWDTGFPDALADGEAVPGAFPGAIMERGLKDQLRRIGVRPDDVEFVALSHHHLDHVGNAADFRQAILLIDPAERALMFSDQGRAMDHYPVFADLEAALYVEIVEDYDLFGDGAVILRRTPGHTPGHLSLQVNLAEAGSVLITGDLYHLKESREARRVPVFNTDAAQTRESMETFEALVAELEARVIVQHSPEDMAALPQPPDYLE